MHDIVHGLGVAAAFGGVGVVLLLLGVGLVDVLTPGRLGRQIWLERNRNASVAAQFRAARDRRHRLHRDHVHLRRVRQGPGGDRSVRSARSGADGGGVLADGPADARAGSVRCWSIRSRTPRCG